MFYDCTPVHILLVEDEAIIALAEKQMLERHGYDVTIAATGEEAVEIATTQPIDLILMDFNLGRGITGGEAAKRILAVRDIPLVFLTNHSDARTIEAVASIPRYGYVVKSNGDAILLEVIRLALVRAADRAAVEHARDLYQSVANLTGDIIVRHDAEGNWVYLNDRAYEVWGVPRKDPASLDYRDYVEVASGDRDLIQEAIRRMKENPQPLSGVVRGMRTVEGWRTYEWNSTPVLGADGSFLGFQSTGRDITAQKEAEERIRRLLEERELLLREVHHRVKNDLNFVYSLLSLQASQKSPGDGKTELSEASDRVRVLAEIYDILNAEEATANVSLQSLIMRITDKARMSTLPDHVGVRQTLANVAVPVRVSVCVGIIYNELITNSAKYGVSESTTPREIVVNLDRPDDRSEVVLSVRDDGPGFPLEVLNGKRYGYGLTVVEALVSQHEGSLIVENSSGAHVSVRLPIPGE